MKSLKIAFLMESNMEFISSDTNIWIDFSIINKLDLPFKLPYIYLMDKDAIEDELLFPTTLKPDLLSLGLQQIEITLNELLLAEQYGTKYKKLSIYDRIAMNFDFFSNISVLTFSFMVKNSLCFFNILLLDNAYSFHDIFYYIITICLLYSCCISCCICYL